MDDNVRLVVELIDKAGAAGQAATGPAAQSSAEVPGSTLAQDTQDRITQQGAGSALGAGSTSPAPLSDPLLNAVRGLVASDPGIQAKELGTALDIPLKRAESLLAASAPSPAVSPPSPAPEAPPEAPSTPNPAPSSPAKDEGLDPDVARFYQNRDIDPDVRAFYESPEPINLAKEIRPTSDDQSPINVNTVPADEVEVVSPQEIAKRAEKAAHEALEKHRADTKNVSQAINLVSGLAGQTGPLGGAASGLLQTFSAVPGATSALASSFPGLAAAAPTITAAAGVAGVALAATAIPAAAFAIGMNEENRAESLVGNFSPEVAAARAEANVRGLQARINTARRLGDEVAEGIEARSRINSATQELRDIFSEPLLQDFNRLLDLVADIAESARDFAKRNEEGIQMGMKGLSSDIAGMISHIFGAGPLGRYILEMLRLTEDIKKNGDKAGTNPIRFYGDKPLPPWPAPFAEGTDKGTPIGIEFDPIPGLNL